MIDYKAKPEQWASVKNLADESYVTQACVLELLSRIEQLEEVTRNVRIDHIRLSNACASLALDRSQFLCSLISDEDDELESDTNNYQSSTHQVNSSLILAVLDAMLNEPGAVASPKQARAAIYAIADVLRKRSGPPLWESPALTWGEIAQWLEEEAHYG